MDNLNLITECFASLAALFLIGYVVYMVVKDTSGRNGTESRGSVPGSWWEYEEKEDA